MESFMGNPYIAYKSSADDIFRRYQRKTAIACLTDSGEVIRHSFSELYGIILATRDALEGCGIAPGDRAAVLTPHSPYGVMAGLALAYSNVTSVLIDAALPAEEIARLLEFSDIRALFTTADLFGKLPPALTEGIPCFRLDTGRAVPEFLPGRSEKVRRSQTPDREPDVIAVIFSSGTTDQMKGVKITYHSVLRARDVFADLSGLKDYMSYLLVLPFNHIAGFTGAMTYFLTGCELDFLEHMEPSRLLDGLQAFQPYYFAMIPRVYEVMEEKIRAGIRARGKGAEMLVNALLGLCGFLRKRFGINIGRRLFRGMVSQVFGRNIYGIGTGASPCKDSTTEFFLNLGLEWANLYATTEAGVPITATGIHDRYPVGTVGNVDRHQGIQVKIRQPDEEGIGEILVKTDLIMKGYFRRPDLTKEAFEDGYFRTGDYGYIDEKRYLHITGRIKEAILLRTGKKISPADIDAYYSGLCGNMRIAACGASGTDGADTVHLFLETGGKDLQTLGRVRNRILEQSAAAPPAYRISSVHEIERLPVTSVGKVKRFVLKEIAESRESEAPGGPSADGAEDILGGICGLIRAATGMTGGMNPGLRLEEDIGMDSLGIFELCAGLEERYGVSVESFLHSQITVGELETIVRKARLPDSSSSAAADVQAYPVEKNGRMVRALRRWIALLSLPYRFHVEGTENIPQGRNLIICPNHASVLDSIWLLNPIKDLVPLQKISGLAAAERLEGCLSKRLFSLLGEIPVNRTGNTAPALRRAKECIEKGYTMIIFPEGARSRDGGMLPFKHGASKLAAETGRMILPVYIGGSFEIFPRHRKSPRLFDWRRFRRYPLLIKFGVPIRSDGKTTDEVTEELKRQIISLKEQRRVL